MSSALGAGSAVFYVSYVLVSKRLGAAFTPPELLGYHALVSAAVLEALVRHDAWVQVPPDAAMLLTAAAVIIGAGAGTAFP